MDKIERKRERLEIIHDILEIIRKNNNSIKVTPLLRYSNLSSNNFKDYLKELKKKNLVKEMIDKKEKKHITLTDNGFKYLEKYDYIKGFINEFNL
jgi:predicted transcriptional regulator